MTENDDADRREDMRRAWALGYQEGVMASRPTVDPLRNTSARNPYVDIDPDDVSKPDPSAVAVLILPEEVTQTPSVFQSRYKRVEAMLYDGRNIQALWDWVGAGVVYGPVEDDENAYVYIRGAKERLEAGYWLVRELDGGGIRPCDPFNFYQLFEAASGGEHRKDSETGKWIGAKFWDLDPDAQTLVLNLVNKLLALEDEINRG